MNKKIVIMCMAIISFVTFGQGTSAVLKYLDSSSYVEGTEKFNGKKDIFKQAIEDKTVVINENASNEGRIKGVFNSVATTIQIGKSWSAVIYMTDPNFPGQKRLVITEETSLKVDGYTYKLTPLKNGVNVKDVRSGNIYKLEVKGR